MLNFLMIINIMKIKLINSIKSMEIDFLYGDIQLIKQNKNK